MIIGNVVVSGIIYPILLLYSKRQSIGIATSGVAKITSFGVEEVFIKIRLKKENILVAQNLRNFIRNTANYCANTFNLVPDSNIDLGNGPGIAITVRYWSDDLQLMCGSGNLYDFSFIFRKEIT
jgi:hypothetical protein